MPDLPAECAGNVFAELASARAKWVENSFTASPHMYAKDKFRQGVFVLTGGNLSPTHGSFFTSAPSRHLSSSGLVYFAVRGHQKVLVALQNWKDPVIVPWNFKISLNLLRGVINRWPAYVPDVDFVLSPLDDGLFCTGAPFPCFSFSARLGSDKVYISNAGQSTIAWPNPYFLRRDWGLPDAESVPWGSRSSKAYWRGSFCGPDDVNDITRFPRARLSAVAKRHPNLFDIGYTGIDEGTPAIENLGAETVRRKYKKFMVARDDFGLTLQRYKYLIHVDGVVAAWRGKQLFAAGGVVLMQRTNWGEFFQADLVPWVHYVPVARNLSDLPDLIQWLEGHQDVAQRIASSGLNFSRTKLNDVSVGCYVLEALNLVATAANYSLTNESQLRTQGFETDFEYLNDADDETTKALRMGMEL